MNTADDPSMKSKKTPLAPVLEVVNLSHRFMDGTEALREITLSFKAGELVLITGKNGSGKTTLVRHLNGLLSPSTGEVRLMGAPIAKSLKNARRRVGMVFQDADSQIVGETVWDDTIFGPENLKWKRDRIDRQAAEVLSAVGLREQYGQAPHTLSGGEKRRLAIAGVLAMDPAVIVFDEPFSNLDYPGVCQVLSQLVALREQGRTLIVITHDVEKVVAHADRIVVMEAGRVVRDGVPSQVLPGIGRYGVREPCASLMGREIPSWLS